MHINHRFIHSIKRNRLILAMFAISLLMLTGCATSLSYKSEYLDSDRIENFDTSLDGRLAIVIPKNEGVYQYIGNPTSAFGGGTSIKMPIGKYSESIATLTLDNLFSKGSQIFPSLEKAKGFSYAVKIKIFEFDYRYISSGISYSTARMKLLVQLYNHDQAQVFEKMYITPFSRSKSNTIFASPESVNQITHELLQETYGQIRMDIFNYIKSKPDKPFI